MNDDGVDYKALPIEEIKIDIDPKIVYNLLFQNTNPASPNRIAVKVSTDIKAEEMKGESFIYVKSEGSEYRLYWREHGELFNYSQTKMATTLGAINLTKFVAGRSTDPRTNLIHLKLPYGYRFSLELMSTILFDIISQHRLPQLPKAPNLSLFNKDILTLIISFSDPRTITNIASANKSLYCWARTQAKLPPAFFEELFQQTQKLIEKKEIKAMAPAVASMKSNQKITLYSSTAILVLISLILMAFGAINLFNPSKKKEGNIEIIISTGILIYTVFHFFCRLTNKLPCWKKPLNEINQKYSNFFAELNFQKEKMRPFLPLPHSAEVKTIPS